MPTLETTFYGHTYDNPFMNASGVHCMDVTELDELASSAAGSFVTKSATADGRKGNPEPRYVNLDLGSINSMGLPNLGLDYYLNYAILRQKSQPDAPFVMSVASYQGFDEYVDNMRQIQDSAYTGLVELNLSCPNVPGKPQMAYDFEDTKRLLTEIFKFYTKPFGVKLPPYFDMQHFDKIANVLNQFDLKFVNCINSIGNGLYIDETTDTVVIKPKGGFGGIGGEYVKPTALANVRALKQRLNPTIEVIGTGGILTGRDAYEHLLCGASMVQVGTQLQKEGVHVFERLTAELLAVLEEKGYQSIAEFKGKLGTLD
ncbi:dihydroorotate dehydrogenase [Lactococcus hodotermopsidis]|uniref:dihydroorotate oxidase (fumarate) n=1 Tax=Pseudolactococcus hodotermopsidis TaxID=2709157 RepID=A0A6A0BB19_9LACT|nr:dihydroorotate oxidase [Lactococcus hodotermopsidis]GFH41651.1 dihydroorotate dehydrogenase [Lactococcus hodotermopsidis]